MCVSNDRDEAMRKTHMVVNKNGTTNNQSSKKRFTALVGNERYQKVRKEMR